MTIYGLWRDISAASANTVRNYSTEDMLYAIWKEIIDLFYMSFDFTAVAHGQIVLLYLSTQR